MRVGCCSGKIIPQCAQIGVKKAFFLFYEEIIYRAADSTNFIE